MRALWIFVFVLAVTIGGFAQTDLQKVVDAEHSFASLAAEKGTKAAFLANMSDDALVFLPEKTNAKTFWSARAESNSLLSWQPNYADVSSNGILGYTTGNSEYRPKGKDDAPTAFGEFITIWVRQPNGIYKFVVDIGVSHPKPEKYSSEWTTSPQKTKEFNERNTSPADVADGFLHTAEQSGLQKAYDQFAASDIRMFREEKSPIIGKKSVLAALKGGKNIIAFARKSTFFGAADISYNLGTYTMSNSGKVTEKGNVLQIWKLINGKWQIVLDILKPVA